MFFVLSLLISFLFSGQTPNLANKNQTGNVKIQKVDIFKTLWNAHKWGLK